MDVPEKTTCYVTAEPKDKDGNAEAPTSATYKIHDIESGVELVAATALTPATSMEIVCKGGVANVLQDSSRDFERRRVTVECDYGSDDTLNGEFIYTVRNLGQVS